MTTKFLELEPHMRRLDLRTDESGLPSDPVWAAVKSGDAVAQQQLLLDLQAEEEAVEERRWRYTRIDKADPDHVYSRNAGKIGALAWLAKIAILRYAIGDPEGELTQRGLPALQEVSIAVDCVISARADADADSSRIRAIRGER